MRKWCLNKNSLSGFFCSHAVISLWFLLFFTVWKFFELYVRTCPAMFSGSFLFIFPAFVLTFTLAFNIFQLGCLGLFWRIQPDRYWSTLSRSPANRYNPESPAAKTGPIPIRRCRTRTQSQLCGFHHYEPRLRWANGAAG